MKFVFLLLVACGGKPAGGDCKGAVDHSVAMANAPETAEQMKLIGPALVGACEKDGWSAEATACMKSAADFKAEDKCQKLLTKEQVRGSERAIQAAISSPPHQ
jgi:hypothetical protein